MALKARLPQRMRSWSARLSRSMSLAFAAEGYRAKRSMHCSRRQSTCMAHAWLMMRSGTKALLQHMKRHGNQDACMAALSSGPISTAIASAQCWRFQPCATILFSRSCKNSDRTHHACADLHEHECSTLGAAQAGIMIVDRSEARMKSLNVPCTPMPGMRLYIRRKIMYAYIDTDMRCPEHCWVSLPRSPCWQGGNPPSQAGSECPAP